MKHGERAKNLVLSCAGAIGLVAFCTAVTILTPVVILVSTLENLLNQE